MFDSNFDEQAHASMLAGIVTTQSQTVCNNQHHLKETLKDGIELVLHTVLYSKDHSIGENDVTDFGQQVDILRLVHPNK